MSRRAAIELTVIAAIGAMIALLVTSGPSRESRAGGYYPAQAAQASAPDGISVVGVGHVRVRPPPKRSEPRRPQTNGKVERYHQTLKREWGRGQRYRSSAHRARALPHWLRYYNEQRRHSAIGNRPPISRVRNVPRQDA